MRSALRCRKPIRRYQSTNGLRQTGYLDSDTLAVMGLGKEQVTDPKIGARICNALNDQKQ